MTHFVLDQAKRATNIPIPSKIGDNKWPEAINSYGHTKRLTIH